MPALGVNIDHVATVRQARRTVEPEPVWAAAEAELGGASCITFHLRVDRRHINDRDAELLRQIVRCKLNMEMSLSEEIIAIAERLAPDQCTLVPEGRQEVTTEGGLDCRGEAARLAAVTERLRAKGVVVSAFVDPDAEQIAAAESAGCDAVEIHTGTYANAWGQPPSPTRRGAIDGALSAIAAGLKCGLEAGLEVHAGHGLTYDNVCPVAALDGWGEFNIGHAIVSRALFVGLRDAVAEMRRLIA